jgi:beta-lactam-binding protein with PASTA domain
LITATGALAAFRRLGVAILIAVVFLFGLGTTVYLSLRSPEVTVPDVLGKDRLEAERVLGDAGLNFRVRATRPSSELKADTVLFQVPRAGEVVKAGQTVAMDISRGVKEGETSEAVAPEKKAEETPENKNTADASAANENKPRRNRNTNQNANDNTAANANHGANANANANRPPANRNANADSTEGNANKATNSNINRPALIINNSNQNGNSRPVTARPSPSVRPRATP